MRLILRFLFLIVVFCNSYAQQETQVVDSLDIKYKEDQYYVGITYNLLSKMPNNMSQNGFSSGFHLGFIKDMPINKQRNWALGIGLGYSGNSVNQNLRIIEQQDKTYTYEILEGSDFSKNKFIQHLIEVPFEIRWRTSTPLTYKFWRIYTGFKLGYVFASNTKFKNSNESTRYSNISSFNEWQYGLTLSIGYDSWNAFLHYQLNPVFKDGSTFNSEPLDIQITKIGIIFYIL